MIVSVSNVMHIDSIYSYVQGFEKISIMKIKKRYVAVKQK